LFLESPQILLQVIFTQLHRLKRHTTMHISKALPIMASLTSAATAQSDVVAPTMSLLYSMACDLGERFSLGPVPFGQERYVIPIIGGTFKGPKISGKHYQLSAYLQ
jgi:hypothetical protein